MSRFAVFFLLLAWLGGAGAQSLEIIALQHRTADQILPQLQALIEPGGALSGVDSHLFVRASPRNQAEIRRVVEALDRPLRRLLITVRRGGQVEAEKVGASGTVVLRPGDSTVRARAGERRYSSRDNALQMVQTIEGGRAMINVGRSFALPFRQAVLTPTGALVSEGLVWRDIGTGFQAAPRVVGDQVTLDISPTHDTPASQPGGVNSQRLTTSVSARLGEWVALGGTTRDASHDRAGTLSYGASTTRDDQQIWLKVDELP